MADEKISALSDGTAPADADVFPISRSGSTLKLLWSEIRETIVGSTFSLPFVLDRPAVAASRTIIASEEGNVFTAVTSGVAGNSITVNLVDNTGTPSVALSVAVVGTAITVQLATDGSGALSSTAAAVASAFNAEPTAAALATASFPPGYTGTAIVTSDNCGLYDLRGGLDDLTFEISETVLNDLQMTGLTLLQLGLVELNGGNNGSLFVRSPGGLPGDANDAVEFDDPVGITKSGVDNLGYFFQGMSTEPDDASFDSNVHRFRLWLDDTPGSAKLMVKAIDSDNTIVSGEIPLT